MIPYLKGETMKSGGPSVMVSLMALPLCLALEYYSLCPPQRKQSLLALRLQSQRLAVMAERCS
jgi:hypothetical protein